MELMDIVTRTQDPEPWSEGEKIPWNEPAFSRRMLAEHLTQDHDLASRRTETIDQHVSWIHHRLLGAEPSRVLDLCCGPGLYCHRLAALGHTCVGIDFGPASIEYATATAGAAGLACTFAESDVRQATYGKGFDLATLIYGELNVFRRKDAQGIIQRAAEALEPGGWIVLEPQTPDVIRSTGEAGSSWSAHRRGLFSDRPHLSLVENAWDDDLRVATTRFFIVDAATGEVTRHAMSVQAYEPSEIVELLEDVGIGGVQLTQAPGDGDLPVQEGLMWLVGRKQGA